MLGSDTRIRIACWSIPACFVLLCAISVFAMQTWRPGPARFGVEALMCVIPALFLVFPTAVALLIFAVARGPVLIVLSGLSALIGFGWSALGAWEIFSSHSSTAAIGIVFLPGLQLFALGAIATLGMVLDGLAGLARGKTGR